MSQAVYLRQKGSDTRLDLDEESYERMLESAAVIGHHASRPILKLS